MSRFGTNVFILSFDWKLFLGESKNEPLLTIDTMIIVKGALRERTTPKEIGAEPHYEKVVRDTLNK